MRAPKVAMASATSDSDVRVTEIEADADIVKVAHFENDDQMLGSGGLAEQIFDQQADAERAGKGAQVLERGERKLDGARRPGIVALAEMDDEIAQRDVLGGFERALDLVHGVDAAGLVGVQHIHPRRAGAAHLAVGKSGACMEKG